MNFCPECNFMVYTKLNKETNKLINYCKKCNWEDNYLGDDENPLVFKKQYSNDFLAEQIYTNKYATLDPTLPRISNIACINEKCLTNLNFRKNRTLHFKNIEEEKLNSYYQSILNIEESTYSNTIIDYNEIISEFSEEIDILSTFSEDQLNREATIDGLGDNIIINVYKKPDREIIFIKYDYVNMKYLYICSTCNTSWKNN